MSVSQQIPFFKRLIVIFLFLVLLLVLLLPFSINFDSDTAKISISVLDYETRWYGGFINRSGGFGTYWDTVTIVFFTLGVANFDSSPHTLEQVNVTTTGTFASNYSAFVHRLSISEEGNLPLILRPQRYWLYNFSCVRCTRFISLQLMVDEQVLDFGVINPVLGQFDTKHLISWTNVHYYNQLMTLSPFSSSLVLLVITGLVIFHRIRKKADSC